VAAAEEAEPGTEETLNGGLSSENSRMNPGNQRTWIGYCSVQRTMTSLKATRSTQESPEWIYNRSATPDGTSIQRDLLGRNDIARRFSNNRQRARRNGTHTFSRGDRGRRDHGVQAGRDGDTSRLTESGPECNSFLDLGPVLQTGVNTLGVHAGGGTDGPCIPTGDISRGCRSGLRCRRSRRCLSDYTVVGMQVISCV
jgi:hypothetical protein